MRHHKIWGSDKDAEDVSKYIYHSDSRLINKEAVSESWVTSVVQIKSQCGWFYINLSVMLLKSGMVENEFNSSFDSGASRGK